MNQKIISKQEKKSSKKQQKYKRQVLNVLDNLNFTNPARNIWI